MIVTTRTPGKLILLGEYVVLEGAPSIVTAVNKYAKISIEESGGHHFILNSPNLEISNLNFTVNNNQSLVFQSAINNTLKNQLHLFSITIGNTINFLQDQKIKYKPLKITIDTGDFYDGSNSKKFGLGSSAAITVGLIKSVYQFYEIPFTTEQLTQSALRAHYEAQGKMGSGIDIVTSINGGIGIFSKTKKVEYKKLTLPDNLFIIPIWTGSSTSTSKFVEQVNQLKKENSEKYNKLMLWLSTLAFQGCTYFMNNESKKFLNIIDQYYESLIDLGKSAKIPIISDKHEKIRSIVRNCKGHYKPSGAGGSDIGVAFTDNDAVKEKIINKINESEFKYIKLETVDNN